MVGEPAANIKVIIQAVMKTVTLGVVFRPFGGLIGARGVTAGGDGLPGRG